MEPAPVPRKEAEDGREKGEGEESADPAQEAEPLGRERIQVQPMAASQRGIRKAVTPSVCSRMSLIAAPKRPIQFLTGRPAAVFSEGSEAR